MIDLHLHLDGSLPVSTVLKLAKEQNIELPSYDEQTLMTYMKAPSDCESLNEYLEKFDLPLKLLQTKEGIESALIDIIEILNAQGIIYAEIRFAPQLHCTKGLLMSEVIETAISGVKKACMGKNITVGLILCCMRGTSNHAENIETIKLAAKYLGSVVCACDLAGAEALFKTKEFEDVFTLANELKVPFTIHAGEADGAESIKTAIGFGAKRIGHGIRAVDDEELMSFIAERGIALECCPISNVQTKAVPSIDRHPVKQFLQAGVKATINTDNMTVSGTTINNEFNSLINAGLINKSDVKELLINAAEAAFMTNKEKERIKNVITKTF